MPSVRRPCSASTPAVSSASYAEPPNEPVSFAPAASAIPKYASPRPYHASPFRGASTTANLSASLPPPPPYQNTRVPGRTTPRHSGAPARLPAGTISRTSPVPTAHGTYAPEPRPAADPAAGVFPMPEGTELPHPGVSVAEGRDQETDSERTTNGSAEELCQTPPPPPYIPRTGAA